MSGNNILRETLNIFCSGGELLPSVAEQFLDKLLAETDENLMAEIFHAWEAKGATEDELFSLAEVMRSRMKRIKSRHATFVDAVGTGGSKVKTFNVSTVAAFVIAGAGIPVAKHGNRAATSSSGSADVLAELGVKADVEPTTAEKCLNKIGICFMFAPRFHSLSPTLGKVRRELGFPTIFNNLGPLCNPANAPHQIIGVCRKDLVDKTANVLARLGAKRSWVVHGGDGLDEITLIGKTFVAEVCGNEVKNFEISVEDFGIANSGHNISRPKTSAESADIIREVMLNQKKISDDENLVLVNAAAAIFVAGGADSLSSAFQIAKESIRTGRAEMKLNNLATETNR